MPSRTGGQISHAWRRAQHGWPPRYPLVQAPNAPLAAALAAWLVAAVTGGAAHDYARAAFYAALAAWAWEEATGGVNLARRVLGAVVLILVVARVGAALGG